MKTKFTWRIWLLIIFLLFSFISILGFPLAIFQEGVLITSVDINSTAFEQGLREGQIITSIDGQEIVDLEDYSNSLEKKFSSKYSNSSSTKFCHLSSYSSRNTS